MSEKFIKSALNGKGFISFQIIQEFLNVATNKFKGIMSSYEAQKYISKMMFPLCSVFPSKELYSQTLKIKERWQYSFYDSLVIAAALEADCGILYTEDLQHNQKINELTIVDPYV